MAHGAALVAVVMMVMLIPLIVPTIITGGGALAPVPARSGLNGTVLGLAIAHTVLCLPYAIINIGVSLQALNPILLRAADGLGASPSMPFRTVLLPNIVPGVAERRSFLRHFLRRAGRLHFSSLACGRSPCR